MFRRKIEKELDQWRSKSTRKPLILRGARQVGKTTLIRKFGMSFDHFLEFNLEKKKDKNFFTHSDDVKNIFDLILIGNNKTYSEHESYLIFIDEIQQYPKAIQLLRYFYEELPHIYVIAAGSLLEFALGEVVSFPVGRVEQLLLYPMSFEEFLLATNKSILYKKWNALEIDSGTHILLNKAFHDYIIVGGMPEIVAQYIEDDHSFKKLANIFKNIWSTYIDDTLKYGKSASQVKTLQYLLQIAPFSSDRINFTKLGQNLYRSREISEALQQLQRAKILHLINPVSSTQLPLIPDIKKRPRLQFLDTALLLNINNRSTEFMFNQDIDDQFRGHIYQHIALQEIMSNSSSVVQQFHFWTRESSTANSEVDIVLAYENKLIPIEVKSGAVGKLRSLHEYMNRAHHNIGIRLLSNQLSLEKVKTSMNKEYNLINVPIYLASKIGEVIASKISRFN